MQKGVLEVFKGCAQKLTPGLARHALGTMMEADNVG